MDTIKENNMTVRYRLAAFAAILAAAVLHSCTYTFDLEGADSGQRLFLNCFPDNTGSAVVSLYVSQPVGMKGNIPPDAGDARIEVTVNGEPRAIKTNGGELAGIRTGVKYIEGPFSAGDRISVHAEKDGISVPVESETTVPESFPGYSISLRKISDEDMEVRVRYRIGEKGYYGIQIVERVTVEENGEQVSQSSGFVSPKDVSDRFSEISNTGGLTSIDFSGGPLMIWEDGIFATDGGMGEYSVKISYSSDSLPAADSEATAGTAVSRTEYSLNLYRLSPEAFRYFYAVSSAESNLLPNMGLSPPVLSYSNVKGGYGVLAGMHLTVSEWLPRP